MKSQVAGDDWSAKMEGNKAVKMARCWAATVEEIEPNGGTDASNNNGTAGLQMHSVVCVTCKTYRHTHTHALSIECILRVNKFCVFMMVMVPTSYIRWLRRRRRCRCSRRSGIRILCESTIQHPAHSFYVSCVHSFLPASCAHTIPVFVASVTALVVAIRSTATNETFYIYEFYMLHSDCYHLNGCDSFHSFPAGFLHRLACRWCASPLFLLLHLNAKLHCGEWLGRPTEPFGYMNLWFWFLFCLLYDFALWKRTEFCRASPCHSMVWFKFRFQYFSMLGFIFSRINYQRNSKTDVCASLNYCTLCARINGWCCGWRHLERGLIGS